MRLGLILLLILIYTKTWSLTCSSSGNGEWNSSSSWNCGRVPIEGDVVVIQSGHLITISNNMYGTGPGARPTLTITINGHLQFDGSGQLNLSTSSTITVTSEGIIDAINSSAGSQIQFGTSGGAEWKASDGPLTNVTLYDGWAPLGFDDIIYKDNYRYSDGDYIRFYSPYNSIKVLQGNYSITIFDQRGFIYFQNIVSESTTWELNSGIYILMLQNNNEIKYHKIIF